MCGLELLYLNVVCDHESQKMQVVYVQFMHIIQQKIFFPEPTSDTQAVHLLNAIIVENLLVGPPLWACSDYDVLRCTIFPCV